VISIKAMLELVNTAHQSDHIGQFTSQLVFLQLQETTLKLMDTKKWKCIL